MAWLKVVAQNRRAILRLMGEAVFGRRTRPTNSVCKNIAAPDFPDEVNA